MLCNGLPKKDKAFLSNLYFLSHKIMRNDYKKGRDLPICEKNHKINMQKDYDIASYLCIM